MNKIQILVWWLERGFDLLPCQANQKHMVRGYGQYQATIRDIEGAVDVFDDESLNVAVLAGESRYILDFDDSRLYAEWKESHQEHARSYTETTPRGGRHVFFAGDPPQGLQLVNGVELKRVALVSPSRVGGVYYRRGDGDILHGIPSVVFSSLSIPGTPTAHLLETNQIASRARRVQMSRESSMVTRIKSRHDIVTLFSMYRPNHMPKNIRPDSRYVMVRCPWHDDSRPSMFLDRDLRIYRCNACGAHGDVINMYATFEGLTVREAIARMAAQEVTK